ncbi:hypothetical protein NESM_000628600 [Novymonas esmeraldas]|uniref:Uncharacterized protein n=1 Tax=Novymonas esmeraldas TaxID=1808958 RepID=A0AAW0EV76_9TRYP
MSFFACSSEGLKRRREEYQLAMQQSSGDQQRHRYLRLDAPPVDGIAAPALHDDDGGGGSKPAGAEVSSTEQHRRAVPSRSSSWAERALSGDDPTVRPRLCSSIASDRPTSASAAFSTTSPSVSRWSAHSSAEEEGHMVITLRPVSVVVVRGDSGRRCAFRVQPTFSYTWHRGNAIYSTADGEQPGLEVHETVTCRVRTPGGVDSHRAAVATTYTSPASSATAVDAPLCSAEDQLLYRDEEGSCSAGVFDGLEDVLADDYSYETAQTWRRRSPPTPPTRGGDSASCLGSCSAALLADCLVKCMQDEAAVAVNDRHGWVYLYHGRHIAADVGRTRLLNDVFARGYAYAADTGTTTAAPAAPHPSELPPLTICVFRKC